MEVQMIMVAVEFTHNLGNYSNIKPYVSISALVGQDEQVSGILHLLRLTALEEIDLLVKEGIIQHKARLADGQEKAF